MTRLYRLLAVLLVATFFASVRDVTTQAAGTGDNWVPASSVGMGNNNYAAYTAYPSPTNGSSDVCFGGWAHSQTDSVATCAGPNTTYTPTMFDSSGGLHTELHVAQIPAFPGNTNRTDTITANAGFRPEARPTYHQNRLYRTGYFTQTGFALDPTAFYEDYNPPHVYSINKISGLIWYKDNLYMSSWSPSTRDAGNNVIEASQGLEIWKHPAFDPNDPYWKNSDVNYLNTIINQWSRVVDAGNGSTNNEGVMHMFIHNNTLYASVFNHVDNPKLLKTTDGTTWTNVDTNIPGNNNYIVSHVTYQGKLVVGLANGGVYSADNASLTNWTSLSAPGGIGHALAVSTDGKTMYAGGRFSGEIYKSIEGAAFELSKRLPPTNPSIGVYSLAATGSRVFAGVGNIPFFRGENANFNFYYDNPRSARVWCLGCAAAGPTQPTLEIELPPTQLVKLQTFRFGDVNCDMSQANFTSASCTNSRGWTFTRDSKDDDNPDPGEHLDDRYIIRVTGFAKGDGFSYEGSNRFFAGISQKLRSLTSAEAFAPPPATLLCTISATACNANTTVPYGYQVTFSNATITNASSYVGYLANQTLPNVYLGTDSCAAGGSKTRLCLKTSVTLRVPERADAVPPLDDLTKFVIESVSSGQGGSIRFEGDVAGSGALSGFGFSDTKAVAVGGNVSALGVTNKISGYTQNSTKIGWDDISADLTKMFNKRTSGTTYGSNSFVSTVWQLNSNSDDPQNGNKTSFSSPPEGKLWNVNSDLTFTSTDKVTFFGRGTIAVDGNVTFNGDVSCSGGQVGIIASGSITFRGDAINCGAFTALGTKSGTTGDITFLGDVTGTTNWEGIFAAKNDVKLPRVNGGALLIRYNTSMADEPTVLFKELLTILFSTSS